MAVFWSILVIITIAGIGAYKYWEMTIDEIIGKLAALDSVFAERYEALTKSIAQFNKYLPEEKTLIFDIQKSKADVAKYAKPKTKEELAQKILNENALTININYLLDKCNFKMAHPDLKECLQKQSDYIKQIDTTAQEYNKLILNYKQIKKIFPFNCFTEMKKDLDLDFDIIKTY